MGGDSGAVELSQLWIRTQNQMSGYVFDDHFFTNFLSPEFPEFAKFASWSPLEPTYRYFKGFLYNLVRNKQGDFFENYKRIGLTGLGNALTVVSHGTSVNLEYLTAIEEFDFLNESMDLGAVKQVVEIGTGYGRTAHTLLRLRPNIERYFAIDLPQTWELARGYLERVAPDLLDKIVFLDYRYPDSWEQLRPDLTLNVDGFHAMTRSALDLYRTSLLVNSRFVYVKNSVCKYEPSAIGLKIDVPKDLFENGLMTEIADIFNEDELVELRIKYERRYRPSIDFDIISARSSESFGFFQHVLYESTQE